MTLRWCLTLCCFLLLPEAQRAYAQSLSEVLAEVYHTNPELVETRASLRATDEGASQALAAFRPSVTLTPSAGLQRHRTRRPSFNGVESRQHLQNRSVKLEVTQNLYNGGGDTAALQRADAQIRSARFDLKAQEQNLFMRTIEVYTQVITDRAVVKLNVNNLERITQSLNMTQARFELGELTKTDVQQATARQARAQADVIQAQGRLKTSQARFREITGLEPRILSLPKTRPRMPPSLKSLEQQILDNNPALLARVHSIHASEAAVTQARAGFRPSLGLSAATTHTRDATFQDDSTDSAQLDLKLSIPLYSQGLPSSRTRQALQQLTGAQISLEVIRRNLIQQARSAWTQLSTARAVITAETAAVQANTIAVEGVTLENLSGGQRTIIDILTAQQDLLNAEVAQVNAQRALTLAHYRILQLAGDLSIETLDLEVERYNPEDNTRKVRDHWGGWWRQGR